MFLRTVAFMEGESIFWIFRRKITHYPITFYFCHDGCCRNDRFSEISSNNVGNFLFRDTFEQIIVSSIYEYLICIFWSWKFFKNTSQCHFHRSSIRFTNTNSINHLCTWSSPCKMTLPFLREFFNGCKQHFSFLWSQFFRICQSWEESKIKIDRDTKSSCHNWTCPGSSPRFIDADKIVCFQLQKKNEWSKWTNPISS